MAITATLMMTTTTERFGDIVEIQGRYYEELKADLMLFENRYAQNPKDVQNMKNLAITMLAATFLIDFDLKQISTWLHGAVKMLDEIVLNFNDDHEARFYLGNSHYRLALLLDYGDLHWNHCLLALKCFQDVQLKAPGVFEQNPKLLELTQKLLKKGPGVWIPEPDDEVTDIKNPGLKLSIHGQKQKMKEEMIQDAVERLLEAMSILTDDNDREVVDELANQIYFNPSTGNKQVNEFREELLASARGGANEALRQYPRDSLKLKGGALASILLWEMMTREMDTNKTEMLLRDALFMLEEVLKIHPNDCEATFFLGKVHYYLWMDSTIHLDFAVRFAHRRKAIECFYDVQDKRAPSDLFEEAQDLLDALYSKKRHTDDNHNRSTDENVMLMKFVGVLFEAMSLGTDQRSKVAGEKSVKDHMLVQQLTSLRRQVDIMMREIGLGENIMNGYDERYEGNEHERESSKSREKGRSSRRDKERDRDSRSGRYRDGDRSEERDRGRDRSRDKERDSHHRDRGREGDSDLYRERSERRDRDDDYHCSRRRDYDRDSRKSRSLARSEHRSRPRSHSKSKRISGFDMAPPTSAMLAGIDSATGLASLPGQIPGAAPAIPGILPNMFSMSTTSFGALPSMPVQAMTQQATRHA